MAELQPLAEPAPVVARTASGGAEAVDDRSPLRLPYLDGLRAVAAFYVVAFHAVLGFAREEFTGPWRLLRRVSAFGHEAVAIFIVLSGYCLMLPVVRKRPEQLTTSLPRFLRRRALRILPPYYVALLASLVAIASLAPLRVGNTGTIWDQSLPALELGPIASHALLVHNWIPAHDFQINGPLWSVATEWQIYFFFPLLLLPVWRRFGPLSALAVAALIGYAPLVLVPAPAATAIPWYLVLFAFGMIAAAVGFSDVVPTGVLRRDWAWGRIAAGLWLVCAAFSTLGAGVWFSMKPLTDALVGLATAALLVHLTARSVASGVERGRLLGFLESRPLVALGHFSYSLYLTHLPVVALCAFALEPLGVPAGPSALLRLFVGGLVALPVAYAFHLAVERPFMLRR